MEDLMKKLVVALLSLVLLMAACTRDNTTEPTDPAGTDGFLTQNIKDAPTYFSIAKKEVVNTFDLIFVNEARAVSLLLNGGVSGSAGVTAKNIGAVDFSASANVDTGFVADVADAMVIGETWYNYDFTTHTLTSKGDVYLIKAFDYNVYKMKIENFGAEGFSISYSLVDADGKPIDVKTATIAAAEGAPGRFSLVAGDVIEKDEWDVAFLTVSLYVPEFGGSIQNPGMRVNSAAGAKIATVENMNYDDIKSVPAGLSYVMDEGDSLAIGDKVLIYNPTNHRLTPPEIVYIVETVDGAFAKVQVTSYYDPESGESGVMNFRASLLE
jgi:hypothetical protein